VKKSRRRAQYVSGTGRHKIEILAREREQVRALRRRFAHLMPGGAR
jgi:hypothetical protein